MKLGPVEPWQALGLEVSPEIDVWHVCGMIRTIRTVQPRWVRLRMLPGSGVSKRSWHTPQRTAFRWAELL